MEMLITFFRKSDDSTQQRILKVIQCWLKTTFLFSEPNAPFSQSLSNLESSNGTLYVESISPVSTVLWE